MSDTPKPEQSSTLQGTSPSLDTPQARAEAIELAFDYRGDVTLATQDGQTYEGYIFDRRRDGDNPHLRLMLKDGSQHRIDYADVLSLTFSGRDTAAGKNWETWVKKYVEKKLKGEKADMPSESLDDD